MPLRKSGGIPQVSTRFSLSMEMSRLARDGTAETVARDQILRHERGRGNIDFPCSADHEHDWQPYPVDPYSCYMCDHTSMESAGVTQEEGHTGGRSHRISHPPSFCGACLNFSREKDSGVPFPPRP